MYFTKHPELIEDLRSLADSQAPEDDTEEGDE